MIENERLSKGNRTMFGQKTKLKIYGRKTNMNKYGKMLKMYGNNKCIENRYENVEKGIEKY